MKQSNNYRLLQLRRILFHETDENHELDLEQLKEKLFKVMDIKKIDHRSIKNDISALQEMGFDVILNRRQHGRLYYSHQNKMFETYQLRLLVDAILSARFITINEKNKLIDKLKELTSKYLAVTLPEPILFSQTINIDYDLIKFNIDRIHQAISKRRVITYQYGNYNVQKQFQYRRDGEIYHVVPYALIWQNDLYYLIGEYIPKNEIRHYRLDRIRNIEITDQPYEKDEKFQLQKYVDNSFHMYSGDDTSIQIRFENSLINPIFDRFGLDVSVQEDGEDHFILKTRAKVSDGLLSWILKWGSQAEVLSPEHLVEQVKEEIEKMRNIYDE